jgi:hypothetical protein
LPVPGRAARAAMMSSYVVEGAPMKAHG